MTTAYTPGVIKQFRRTSWRFEQTFQTPLDDLQGFVATIVTAYRPLADATLTSDQVVFDADQLKNLVGQDASSTLFQRDASIFSTNPEEVPALLVSAFSDWIDFLFVPRPKPFVIYADHDEWVTFYGNTKSNLNRIVLPLKSAGYKLITDWRRKL